MFQKLQTELSGGQKPTTTAAVASPTEAPTESPSLQNGPVPTSISPVFQRYTLYMYMIIMKLLVLYDTVSVHYNSCRERGKRENLLVLTCGDVTPVIRSFCPPCLQIQYISVIVVVAVYSLLL